MTRCIQPFSAQRLVDLLVQEGELHDILRRNERKEQVGDEVEVVRWEWTAVEVRGDTRRCRWRLVSLASYLPHPDALGVAGQQHALQTISAIADWVVHPVDVSLAFGT